jgi:uncharacterized membrane protein
MGHQRLHDADPAQTISFLILTMTNAFLSVTAVIGRLHPALVHLPIGILLTGLLLQWLHARGRPAVSLSVVRIVFGTGALTAWLSCSTGLLLSWNEDYDAGLVDWHGWMGFSVAVVSSLVYWKIHLGQTDRIYKSLSAVLLVLIFITGHLGGSLTHGSDYLVAALRPTDETAGVPSKPITNVQEARVYADIIQPLFQKECYNCHGSGHQKGKLCLDDSSRILKGGKTGPALIPFRPAESELMKRILLPKEDEHHMPREKPSLKEGQIALLNWWISRGADFHSKVRAFDQPEKIKTILLALQNNQGSQADSLVPREPVAAADPKAIMALEQKGVQVMQVAKNIQYLSADFVNGHGIGDAEINLLLPLKKQLIWLKLENMNISDASMPSLAQCQSLTSLQLNHTGITDRGLAALQSLKQLQSLNLVGTAVTASGVLSLQSLKQLKHLYLYQSGVKQKDWTMLRKAFPKAELDSGGYTLPFLASDTVVLKAPRKN